MGFLDHSTNNIIVDAVLTDLGRQRLSKNDGSFNIVKFALGDDEVDYTIIQNFGLTIGREKIEKNTPIFEAQTSSTHGLKHKLLSLSSQVQTTLPILQQTPAGIIELQNNGAEVQVTITQVPGTGGSGNIPPDLQESVLMVRASTRFIDVRDGNTTLSPVYATERDRMGIYRVTTGVSGDNNNRTKMIKFKQKASLSQNSTVFSTFGDSTRNIYTNVVITGLLTGASLNLSFKLLPPADII